jgi:hypothetical protein
MNIYEKLSAVQQELKAPKDKMNKFAGYSYRSAEGILEAVKPLLKKNDATIILSDEIVEVGGRIYVKATALFRDTKAIPVTEFNYDEDEREHKTMWEGFAKAIIVTAYAREAEDKKGLDVSQITGTASSYARKYALNGLLLIDDTKDPDTDEYATQTGAAKKEDYGDPDALVSAETVALIKKMATDAKLDIKTILTKPVEQLTNKQAGSLIQSLKKRIGG